MPIIDRMHADLDHPQDQPPVRVLDELLPIMHAAGIRNAAGDRKLSHGQLDLMLAGKAIHEKIRIKLLAERSGVYPDPL